MPSTPKRAASVVCTVALLVLSAGCGKDDATATKKATPSASVSQLLPSGGPSTSSAGPATGPTLEGTGYTVNLPDGWSDITKSEQASEPQIDVAGRSDTKTGDFTANLSVLVTDSTITGSPTRVQLNALAIAAAAEIKTSVKSPATLELASMGGSPAVHQEGSAQYGQTPFYLVQYVTVRGGKNYVLTFSFPTGVDTDARDKVIDPVLASFDFS